MSLPGTFKSTEEGEEEISEKGRLSNDTPNETSFKSTECFVTCHTWFHLVASRRLSFRYKTTDKSSVLLLHVACQHHDHDSASVVQYLNRLYENLFVMSIFMITLLFFVQAAVPSMIP
jgi:hypothetical protein